MPTSATGTSTNNARERGFTLIELLVVMLIAGILMAAVLLSVRGGGEERLAREEIQRLDRLVTLASDEAIYRLLEIGLEFHREGYRFLVWTGDIWMPLPEPGPLRAHRWPEALTASLTVEAKPTVLPATLAAEAPVPQVVFLSSGEVSAFQIDLLAANGLGERLQVHVTADTERAPLGDTP
ncbi:MAG: type II secretion system minor pseudopilin GspH [Gammaproteobacteria bacterium]